MSFNLPAGSAIPQAVVNFQAIALAALTAYVPAGTPVTVWWGEQLPSWSAPYTLQITKVEGNQDPATMSPNFTREETFQLLCLLSYYEGGDQADAFAHGLTNVMGAFHSIAQAVATNPHLTQPTDTWQTVRFAEVGNFALEPITDQSGMSAVTLAFDVRCSQRVQSLV